MKHRHVLLLAGAIAGSSALAVAPGRTALASCPASPISGSCSATVDLEDAEYAYHGVPFNSVALTDTTPDTPLAMQRHWFFIANNHGPGDVGAAAITANTPRTYSATPPPPYTAATTAHLCPDALTAGLCPNDVLRTSSATESAYSTDMVAPGFSSRRTFNTDVIPPGGTTQTLTASFTVDTPPGYVNLAGLILDFSNNASQPIFGESWSFVSSSDPPDTTVSSSPPVVEVGINNPVPGTTYTVTFSGTVPNSSAQAITYKPRLQFQTGHDGGVGGVFGNSYSFCDTLLEGAASCSEAGGVNVTWSFDDSYELHPGTDNKASVVDYQSSIGSIAGSYPASGAFVIGDGNAAPGTAVTYWGSQWRTLNSLSGGTAPSAFKGFEDGGQPATCGAGVSWTTDPGNSAPPPAGVPGLMLVIVSSHVSQQGSILSGDVAHLVVVRTNPDYSSDPGHFGTGTVLGQVC